MAITNTKLPSRVSLSGAPSHLELTSNLPLNQYPTNYLRIRFLNNGPQVGEKLKLAYRDVVIEFTFQAAADASGETLSVKAAAQSLADYETQIETELFKNYHIASDFEIQEVTASSAGIVRIEPIDLQEEIQITHNLTDTQVEHVFSANNAYLAYPQLLVMNSIYDHELATYLPPVSHRKPLIEQIGTVSFALGDDFALDYHLPNAASITLQEAEKTTRNWLKYRIQYAEYGGIPPKAQALAGGNEEYIMLHGSQSFFEQYRDWWTFFKNSEQFLTTRAQKKVVALEQPEWLYWIARQTAAHYISVQVTYRDTTTQVFDQPFVISLQEGEVAYFSVGFTQLGFECDEDNPIISYKVTMYANALPVSLEYEYELTTDTVPYERYFVFGNSIGGMDTVRITGKQTVSSTITTQEGERVVTGTVLEDRLGSQLNFGRNSQRSFTQRSGYKSKAEIDELEKLLRIGSAWLIIDNEFFPILIDGQSIELYDDGEDLHAISWSFRYAWEE